MATTSPDDTTTPAPAADDRVVALEQRIEQLTHAIERTGDTNGQLTQLVGNLQQQLTTLVPQRTPEPPEATEPSEEFKRFYGNQKQYIKDVALEASREAIGPHLINQALQVKDAILAHARASVDSEHGDGFWDEKIAKDLDTTLSTLPIEMQASRQHLEAAVSAIMGRMYFDPEARKDMEGRRTKATKAREESMNMLPGGRPRPPRPDQLDEMERRFLDSLERSGFSVNEAQYKFAKGAPRTIDEWRAAKAASAPKGK